MPKWTESLLKYIAGTVLILKIKRNAVTKKQTKRVSCSTATRIIGIKYRAELKFWLRFLLIIFWYFTIIK